MIKVLITGSGSYIGTYFSEYINTNYQGEYIIDTVDMIGDSWRETDFSNYDCIFHVAGIAHSDSGKISPEREKLYYAVNTDLTIEVAKKAKESGVKQFVFMSSAIVYGESAPIGKNKIITDKTPVNPSNCYGNSKVLAEKGLFELDDKNFKTVVLRPPMIYGKGCKGNYQLLTKIALKLPVFPYVANSRSMLYIENLCEFVRLVIKNEERGIFYPQNSEYTNTSYMVKKIADSYNKKLYLVKGFSFVLKLLSFFIPLINKAFGSLCYDQNISEYKTDYRKYSLDESIEKTVIK
ncbi:MAG: NAD-dependent epimerase/dehydratase family protein [Ruminococcaceae bacterium]|nr:NAD-dependent epimerase/dehydratase family protein [Oscillospiraceae bacterium]